jgi:4-hydroxybenzoate polyprenyltransferase
MGGQLADLASAYPEKYGSNSFLKKYPYATPAFVNAAMLLITFMAIFFFLEEVCPPMAPWMYVSSVLIILHVPRHINRRGVAPTLV